MKKNLTLVWVMLGLWSTSLMAIPVEPIVISKITLQKDNAKITLENNVFKQVVEQNFVDAIANKIDHDIAIKVFNQSKNWESLTGDPSGTHLLRFSISATKFITGKFKIKGAKNASFYLNQIAIEGDNDFTLELLNQDYRALLIVSGVEQWQDFSIEWLDDVLDDNKPQPANQQQGHLRPRA
jgi:acylaminoacyl-peptidase